MQKLGEFQWVYSKGQEGQMTLSGQSQSSVFGNLIFNILTNASSKMALRNAEYEAKQIQDVGCPQ